MTEKEFNKFLRSVGGLSMGWNIIPNKKYHRFQYYAFKFCKWMGYEEKNNPFKVKIKTRDFFSVADGWLPLLKNLIEALIKAGWNKEVYQVKEKFGGLRFYIGEGSDEMYEIIYQAESQSYKICEDCGKDGKLRKGGWMRTLCDEHDTKK